MQNTLVKDIMEDTLVTIEPEATLAEAARQMKAANCGCLLVRDGSKPDGIITDRDIVVRALSKDLDPAEEKVADHMTGLVMTCSVDDTLSHAAELMREHSISRLVALDPQGYPCGIITFGRILRNHEGGEELSEIVACATGRKEVFRAQKTLSETSGRPH
jgi:CBS domain-containing protein